MKPFCLIIKAINYSLGPSDLRNDAVFSENVEIGNGVIAVGPRNMQVAYLFDTAGNQIQKRYTSILQFGLEKYCNYNINRLGLRCHDCI